VDDHGFNIVSPDSANPLTPSTSPGRENGSTNQALHRLIRQDLPDIPSLVHVFFSDIHPYWPILHVPTFDKENTSDLLLGSIIMLSSWLVGRHEHKEIAPIVFKEVVAGTGLVCLIVFL
jgi:hypothetical protein